jgi:hypothetical protein
VEVLQGKPIAEAIAKAFIIWWLWYVFK